MAPRENPAHEERTEERRTPLGNDIDPDGMDSESEGDELEAGGGEPSAPDDDDHVEPDGARE